MTRSQAAPFTPPVRPKLSRGEVDAYKAMIDGTLAPDPTLLKSSPPVSVAVVGAGLSGLAAARELKKAGINVLILEATERAGGRCLTISAPAFDEGVRAEAGGMRFPDSHEIITKYIELFQLETIGFSNMKDRNGLLYLNGIKKPIKDELQNPESLLSRVIANWEESISPILEALKSNEQSWDDLAAVYGEMSVAEFLQENGWSEELMEGFGKCGVGLGAYGAIMHLSALEILRLFVSDGDGYESKNLQLKGGMESLSQRFLNDNEVPLDVEFGCKVASIKQQPDGRYQVIGEKKGSTEQYDCNFVIVTVPLPILSTISFDPPLSDDLRDAINDMHYPKAVKIFLQTKSPFWLRQGIDGMVISDLKIQNTYFAPQELSNGKGLITASYTWEKAAEELFPLSTQEKISLAIAELKQIFPEIEDEFEKGDAIEWEQAFCIFKPGQAENHRFIRTEALPKVYLAGEHTSVEHGYFEGALESGIRAAANVFRSIDAFFLLAFERVVNDVATSSCDGSTTRDDAQELTVQAERLDQNTLTFRAANEVANYHVKAFVFELDSIKPINLGTISNDKVNMLNYILYWTLDKDMVGVITEGLNDDTIFRKCLNSHGPWAHRVTFEVADVDAVSADIKSAGITACCDKVTADVLSGLKQFVIPPCQGPRLFIEQEAISEKTKDENEDVDNYYQYRVFGWQWPTWRPPST